MSDQALRVFIMYAHEDKSVRDKLIQHFRPLVKSGEVELWSDHEIKPGALWDTEIRARLEESSLIIMLVSDDFFASEYIHNVEMTSALARHSRGEARLLPVIARHCSWSEAPEIARLQVLPPEGKPVISQRWDSPDEPYVEVIKGVKAAIKALRKPVPVEPPKPVPPPAPPPKPPVTDTPKPIPPPPAPKPLAPNRNLLASGGVLLLALLAWGVYQYTRDQDSGPATENANPSNTRSTVKGALTPVSQPDSPKVENKPREKSPTQNPTVKPPTTKPDLNAQPKPKPDIPQPEPKYDRKLEAKDGMARIQKGKLWSFENTATGKILDDWYDDVENFDDGRAFVTKGGKSYYINKKGDCVEGCK